MRHSCWGTLSAGERMVSLIVEVLGLATDAGTLHCSLYADARAWLSDEHVLRSATAQVRGGRGVCDFADLAPGQYAVAVHLDVNDNGTMDFSALGLPKEPWGVSRDAPVWFGPPRFGDAAFRVPVVGSIVIHAR